VKLKEEEIEDVIFEHSENVTKYLVDTNSASYNKLKLAEELSELLELLLKQQTKWKNHKPTDDDLVEELGDVMFRLTPVIKMVGEDKVLARLAYKIMNVKGYMDKKEHVGEL
jgi:NTP pyrophosphatase (non-canonical NTP hydrolase)